MAGKTIIAGNFPGLGLGIVMTATGHRVHLAGIDMHNHGLVMRFACRHGERRLPVQGQAHQHGEQHDQPA